jgi:hypothetical protein
MARENSGWGYDRIVGALANLGHQVSDQTLGNILRRYGIAPAPKRSQITTWKDFLSTHMNVLAGCGPLYCSSLTFFHTVNNLPVQRFLNGVRHRDRRACTMATLLIGFEPAILGVANPAVHRRAHGAEAAGISSRDSAPQPCGRKVKASPALITRVGDMAH